MEPELGAVGAWDTTAADVGAPLETASTTFVSLHKALEVARGKLLDRSLRNKLISTNLTSTRARQVRVFDELSDQVFGLLQSGKVAMFAAATGRGAAEQAPSEGQSDDDAIWVPPDDDGANDQGVAARHRDNKLQTKLSPEGLQKRLTSLLYEGQTIEEEQGVSVLFLALGFLEWREARQSEIARYAPLVLLPVELVRDGAKDRFKLRSRQEDLYTNVSLQAWLDEQFGIDLPDLPETDEWCPSEYFDQVENAVGTRPGWAVHSNEIVLGFFSFSKFLMWRDLDPTNWPDSTVLSDSSLLKNILLRDDGDDLLDEPLVGDDERIDEVFKPADLVHITDADSSQAIAIQEAMAGKNLVIQGPPGTGKSQTITNIIAGAVKRGKRVLFIAEKMAALEVVHQRLVNAKLGPICLELHSRKSSKAQVIEQIKQARGAAAPPAWPNGAMRELEGVQQRLRAHSDRMHRRDGDGLSAYDLLGRMSLIKARGAPAPTFVLPEAAEWSIDRVEAVDGRATRFGERLAAAGVPCAHPWRGAGIGAPDLLEQERLRPRVDDVARAAALLGPVATRARAVLAPASDDSLAEMRTWAAALGHLAGRPAIADALLGADTLIPLIDSLSRLADEGERLLAIRARLDTKIRSDAWRSDWSQVRRIIVGQGRSVLRMFSSRYRQAIAELRGAWIGGLPKNHLARTQALDDLIEGARLADLIRLAEISPGVALGALWSGEQTDWTLLRSVLAWLSETRRFDPKINLRTPEKLIEVEIAGRLGSDLKDALASADDSLSELTRAVALDEQVALDGRQRADLTVSELDGLAGRWSDRFADLVQWPSIRDDLKWLREIGCHALADQIFVGTIAAERVAEVLLLAIYEAMWTRVRSLDPEIGKTAGDELNQLVGRFRKADVDRIGLAADEVARAHIDQHPSGSAGAVGILNDETRKSRNLKPVRKLMEQAGEAIQRFKPVFLMSPLSVAQYLAPGEVKFDLLVIDEASQVRPEDALGAIARCGQLVVVGDNKQLPPTNFFNRMINDDEEGDEPEDDLLEGAPRRAALKDIESILNLCSRFPERMLRWHYRSEHPALIAVSNRNFYEDKLLLPPSIIAKATDGDAGLIFHKVAEGGYDRGRTARNEIEAEDVAQAALRHARERPDLSLGIGAFSVAQRDAIRDRLDHLCRLHPELDEFVKGRASIENRSPAGKVNHLVREPVFVKNLENIQGDERDVIFISVGYGKDKDGRFIQSFGPVGAQGGERRLNVLITRARKRCEVFSSIVAEDIRIEGAGKPGVGALKEFLKLAKDGYIDTPSATGRGFDSDFEEAVAYAIKTLGYEFHPQVGMAGFFVDIGVIDPRNSDRYLLGVECDGAAYHSSRYARDRDRLRQMILEKRGWKLHRIWSTDWFYRRDREVVRLKESIEAALAGRSAPTAANVYDFEPLIDPELPLPEPAAEIEVAESGAEFRAAGEVEVELSDRRNGRLRPYEYADFRVFGGQITEPHTLFDGQLADIVERIVLVEQPIHEEEVGRRLAHVCGLQRAGGRIQQAAMRGLRYARRRGHLQTHERFWSEDLKAEVNPRSRVLLGAADTVRKPEMIGGAEFAAAAVIALEQNMALSQGELTVETARLIGFARVGKDVAAAVQDAINERLGGRVELDHLERIKLKPNHL